MEVNHAHLKLLCHDYELFGLFIVSGLNREEGGRSQPLNTNLATDFPSQLAEFELIFVEAEDLSLFAIGVSYESAVESYLIYTMIATFLNSQDLFVCYS